MIFWRIGTAADLHPLIMFPSIIALAPSVTLTPYALTPQVTPQSPHPPPGKHIGRVLQVRVELRGWHAGGRGQHVRVKEPAGMQTGLRERRPAGSERVAFKFAQRPVAYRHNGGVGDFGEERTAGANSCPHDRHHAKRTLLNFALPCVRKTVASREILHLLRHCQPRSTLTLPHGTLTAPSRHSHATLAHLSSISHAPSRPFTPPHASHTHVARTPHACLTHHARLQA